MKYPSEAFGTISTSQTFLLLIIINVLAHATHMARRILLSQQHLLVLRCMAATPKKFLIIYLQKVELTINDDCDTNKEWITGTMSDAADRL
eukprot:3207608-Ditylum_brightwellii.AAC.1